MTTKERITCSAIYKNGLHKESTVLFDEQEYYNGLFGEQTDEPQS